MVLYKRIIKIYFSFLFLFIISACYTNELKQIDKIEVYYNFDYFFHYDGYKKNLSVEKGSSQEIFNINNVSKQYQKVVNEYVNKFNDFINTNFTLLKEYYLAATDLSIPEEDFTNLYNNLYIIIEKKLLPSLPGAVRCMVASFDIQYLQVAIQINENLSARTVNEDSLSSVYWKGYLREDPPPYINPEGVLDDQGVIKYHEWFYESNLKLRVVKQIRDKDGKYYGEIYADYYKLDEYDNLFDKDGNPKHPKEDAK